MATHDLGKIKKTGEETTHGYITVQWDDVAEAIINDQTIQEDGGEITTDYNYSFCTDTTKTYFVLQLTYPYAVKYEDTNSVDCNFAVCDIVINLPIQTTNDSGAQDGTVLITATGSGTLEYKLDYFGTYQETGIFTGKSYGSHKAYVRRVGSDCVKTVDFEIDLAETFSNRFRAEFNNNDSDNFIIYVKKKSYTGEVENVTCGNAPLVINYDKGKSKISDLYNTVKGSNAQIKLLADTNNQFDELFAINERDLKVSIYKNTVIFWEGYIIPNAYQEPYKSIYTISFTAVDGLGTLRTKDFKGTGYYSGWKSELEVLQICLNKLDLKLNICDGINVKETTMTDGGTLNQAYINLDKYSETKSGETQVWNCYDVINDVLLKYGAYIKQIDNEWCILNKQTTYDLWCYDYALTYIEKREETGYKTLTNDTGSLYFINADAVRELYPAFQKFSIKQDYGLTHIIKNWNFENWTVINTVNTIDIWGGDATYSRENDQIRILGKTVETISECTYIQSADNDILIDADANLKIKIKFTIPLFTPGTTLDEYHELPIALIIDDKTWNGTEWQSDPNDVLLIRADGQTTEYESGLIPITYSGKLKIKVFECMWRLVSISDRSVTVTIDNCDVVLIQDPTLKEFLTIEKENDDNFSFMPDELEITSGDLPDINNTLVYNNGVKISDTPSKLWTSPYGEDTIINLLGVDILTQHRAVKSILTGMVYGDLDDIIYNNFDSKYYFVTDKSTNYRTNDSEVTLMQVEITETSDIDYLKTNDFDYLLINADDDRLIL